MRRFIVPSAVLMAALASCAGPARVVGVSVEGVKVTPQSLQLEAVGDTSTIVATIAPADATDRLIVWESTDSTVVRVDAGGHVTAMAIGAGVFVTAFSHDGRHQASVNVSVGQ